VSQPKQKAQLSLGYTTVLALTDLQGHPKSMICTSSETAYATSY